MAKNVSVKIFDLPGGTRSSERAAQIGQKMEELRAALEEAFPGVVSLEYVNLRENPAAAEDAAAQLMLAGRCPAPLVVIEGEARFAGSIRVGTILKAVGRALAGRSG